MNEGYKMLLLSTWWKIGEGTREWVMKILVENQRVPSFLTPVWSRWNLKSQIASPKNCTWVYSYVLEKTTWHSITNLFPVSLLAEQALFCFHWEVCTDIFSIRYLAPGCALWNYPKLNRTFARHGVSFPCFLCLPQMFIMGLKLWVIMWIIRRPF